MRPTLPTPRRPGFRTTSRGRFSPCRSAIRGAASRSSSTAATRPEPISTATSAVLLGSLARDAEIAYAQVESETLHRRVAELEEQLARTLEPR